MDFTEYAIIDFAELEANTMNNRSLQDELFELFFDQAELYIASLRAALSEQSVEAWQMTAHGVKGASASLGFQRLSKIAGACESGLFSAEALALIEKTVRETFTAAERREAA